MSNVVIVEFSSMPITFTVTNLANCRVRARLSRIRKVQRRFQMKLLIVAVPDEMTFVNHTAAASGRNGTPVRFTNAPPSVRGTGV